MTKCIELLEISFKPQNSLHQQEGCEQFVSTVLVPIEIDVACAAGARDVPQCWK